MAGIVLTRLIRAPRERVFQAFTELEEAPGRVRGILRIDVLTPGPVSEGTRFRETRLLLGEEVTEELEFTELEAPERYVVEGDSQDMHYRTELIFEEAEDATEVTVRLVAEPRSLAARLASPLGGLVLSQLEQECLQDLDDIQAHLERA